VFHRLLFQKYMVMEKDADAAVFITGCSSGFGFDLARHLADSGMVVRDIFRCYSIPKVHFSVFCCRFSLVSENSKTHSP
jgi:hypothetical protein